MNLVIIPVNTTLVLGCLLGYVLSYSTGPPSLACSDMFPTGHLTMAQSSTPPVSISVSQNTYLAGDTLTVTIATKDSSNFKGFYVQARPTSGATSALGTFTSGGNDMLHDCLGSTSSAISHSNSDDKTSATFTWQPSTNDNVDIVFRATIVQSWRVFWVDVKSVNIRYVGQAPLPPVGTGVRSGSISAYLLCIVPVIILSSLYGHI